MQRAGCRAGWAAHANPTTTPQATRPWRPRPRAPPPPPPQQQQQCRRRGGARWARWAPSWTACQRRTTCTLTALCGGRRPANLRLLQRTRTRRRRGAGRNSATATERCERRRGGWVCGGGLAGRHARVPPRAAAVLLLLPHSSLARRNAASTLRAARRVGGRVGGHAGGRVGGGGAASQQYLACTRVCRSRRVPSPHQHCTPASPT